MNEKVLKVNSFIEAVNILGNLSYLDKVTIDLSQLNEEEYSKAKDFIDGFVFGRGICTKTIDDRSILLCSIDSNFKYDFNREEANAFNFTLISKEQVTEVAKGFLEGKKVIFDVSKLETNIAKTSFNFLSGVAYSLEGNLEKVASDVFAITPAFKCLFLDGFEDEIINEELDKVRDYKADFSEENIIALHNLYEKLYNEKASMDDRFAVKYGTFLIDVGQRAKGMEVLKKYILQYEGGDDDLFKTVAKVVIAFSMKKELK